MHRKCFSYEASGHKFRPLDGMAGVVVRLFCTRCGRVIPADERFNTAMWAGVEVPPEVQDELASPDEPVH